MQNLTPTTHLFAASSARRRLGFSAAAALGAASLVLATSVVTGFAVAGGSPAATDAATAAAIDQASGLSKAFRHATRAIQPSVVSIEAVKKAPAAPAMRFGGPNGGPGGQQLPPGVDPEDLFKRFFGQGGGGQGGAPFGPLPHATPEMRGEGSGVIVESDGYIITNNHVVAGADKLTVSLDDGRKFEATVVGTDAESDLALIKIESSNLPAATLGDSEDLETGDWVVAVGSPYGLDHTVTAGIVSATQRRNMGVAVFENFIQTDAAINPGNSGGPLVNLKGEVVGINTAIRSGGGGNDGIGFAIPTSTVRHVMDGLKAGKVERGYLGIRPQMLDEHLASSFDFHGEGVLVADVVAGEPGAKAGLQPGDIITRIDGSEIDSPAALVNAIGSRTPGSTAKLDLVRDGKRMTLDATLGSRPGAPGQTGGGAPAAAPAPEGLEALGLRAEPIDEGNRERFQLGESAGLVVTDIAEGSPAAKAGLQPGDVILNAGGREITSAKDLAEARKDAGDKPLRLRVKSGEQTRFLVIR